MMSKIGAVSLLHQTDAETLRVAYPREGKNREGVKVRLMSPVGEEVPVTIAVRKLTADSIEITIQNRPTGIFFLRIQDGTSYIMKKIILQ